MSTLKRSFDSTYLILRSASIRCPTLDPSPLMEWLLEALPLLADEEWASRPERAERVPVIIDKDFKPIGFLIDTEVTRWGLRIGNGVQAVGRMQSDDMKVQRLRDWEQWREVTLAIEYPVK